MALNYTIVKLGIIAEFSIDLPRCNERSPKQNRLPEIPEGGFLEGSRPSAQAAKLPCLIRLAFCASLRGLSLNRRAAVPPRMLCLPFSDRNGRS
jgi:hypothetical protein